MFQKCSTLKRVLLNTQTFCPSNNHSSRYLINMSYLRFTVLTCRLLNNHIFDKEYLVQVRKGCILTVQKHILIVMDLLLALNIITYIHYWKRIDLSNTGTRQSTLVNGWVPDAIRCNINENNVFKNSAITKINC